MESSVKVKDLLPDVQLPKEVIKKKSAYKKLSAAKKKKNQKLRLKNESDQQEKTILKISKKDDDDNKTIRMIKNSEKKLSDAELTAKALKLRIRCWSIAKIADTLNVSVGKIHKVINDSLTTAIKAQTKDNSEGALIMELSRLDNLFKIAYEKLKADALGLLGMKDAIKIVEVRSKLLGLNTPEKPQIEVEDKGKQDKKNKLEDILKKMIKTNQSDSQKD